MNKRILKYVLLLLIYSSINGQTFELNFSLGKDFYKVNDLEKGFELLDLTEANIYRKGFSNPFLLGFGLSYTFKQNYILSFDADINYLEYSVKYSRNYPQFTNPFNIKTSNYDVPWVRLGSFINFEYMLASYDNFNFLIGVGLGLQVFSPAVSDKFLYETLLDKLSELDTSGDIKLNVSFAQKINGGIKYRIENSNFNISVNSSITFVSKTEYESPRNFVSIKLILGYLF